MPTKKQARIEPIVDRLFYDLRLEKDLLAQKKDIDGRLKAVRRSMALGIAELHARSGVVSAGFEKTDYLCGCIVICGHVWRDCSKDVVRPNDYGRAAYNYEMEANARGRKRGQAQEDLPHPEFDENGKRIVGAKPKCARKKET